MSEDVAWYLIYTKPQQEGVALTNLLQQHFLAYLPMMDSRKRQRGEYRMVTEPMFPRYVFVQLNRETDNWSVIRSTRGVANLVRFGLAPARVPDDFVCMLQSREKNELLPKEKEDLFVTGDQVKILDGPFAGMEAVYDVKKPGERAVILLQIANNYTRVKLSEHELGKV